MSAPREDRAGLGVALGIGAFFAFAWVDTSAKSLVAAGFPVLLVVLVRYLGQFVLVLAWFLPRDGWAAVRSDVPGMQVLRGLFLLTGTVLNFWALKYLPLTTTIPIFFATPLVVCLLSVPLLKEPVGLRRYLAVIVGFIGVVVVVRPGGLAFHWAMLLSIGATTCAALYFLMTRMIAGRDDTAVSQVFSSGIATLVLLPVALTAWEWPSNGVQAVYFVLAGLAAALGHTMLTVASRYTEASRVAPLVYTQIIWVTLISWLIFATVPDRWTVLGTAIIIGSGLYVWWRERAIGGSR